MDKYMLRPDIAEMLGVTPGEVTKAQAEIYANYLGVHLSTVVEGIGSDADDADEE